MPPWNLSQKYLVENNHIKFKGADINNNKINLIINKLIDNTSENINKSVRQFYGYSRNDVHQRLMQRLAELALLNLSQKLKSKYDQLDENIQNDDEIFLSKFGCVKSGCIKVSYLQIALNICRFFYFWLRCLRGIIFVKKTAKSFQATPRVMLYGIPTSIFSGSTTEAAFQEFCRYGPVDYLHSIKNFVVQGEIDDEKVINGSTIQCTRDPISKLLSQVNLGWRRASLFFEHIGTIFVYFYSILLLRETSLLGEDFAYAAVARGINRLDVISGIFFTNSNLAKQPLWSRAMDCQTNMIWYAQNYKPIGFKRDVLESELPTMKWVGVDVHWVWTLAFKIYLKSIGVASLINVVGPIVFYNNTIQLKSIKSDEINIAVFDTPAYSDKVAFSTGEVFNYYNPNNLLKFIEGILHLKHRLEGCMEKKIIIRVKSKRKYHSQYDLMYFKYLEDLERKNSIVLESPNESIFELVSKSDIVIGYPFTSPIYIADSMRIPSIYYDPTELISCHHFGENNSLINFASGELELISKSIRLLDKSCQK